MQRLSLKKWRADNKREKGNVARESAVNRPFIRLLVPLSVRFSRLPPSAHALHSLHPLHTRRRREWAKRALHVPLGTPYGEWSVRRVNGSRRRGKGSFMKVSINYGLRVGWWWVEDGNLHERALHCYRRVLGRLSAPVHHSLLPSGFVHGGPRSPVVSLASVPCSLRSPRGNRGPAARRKEWWETGTRRDAERGWEQGAEEWDDKRRDWTDLTTCFSHSLTHSSHSRRIPFPSRISHHDP